MYRMAINLTKIFRHMLEIFPTRQMVDNFIFFSLGRLEMHTNLLFQKRNKTLSLDILFYRLDIQFYYYQYILVFTT